MDRQPGVRVVWDSKSQTYRVFLDIKSPSEPRKTKRQAQNPFATRPGRGQTTQYRADKVAQDTLTEDYVGPLPMSADQALQTILEWLDPSLKLARLQRYR